MSCNFFDNTVLGYHFFFTKTLQNSTFTGECADPSTV